MMISSTSKIRCELCDVELSSEAQLAAHNEGKRHLKKVTEREAFSALASRSVFVCGLPLKFLTDKNQIEDEMKKFGNVERILLDPNKGSYAIVEFFDEESAKAALSVGKISVGEHTALLRERKVDFDNSQAKFEKKTVDVESVIKELEKVGPPYNLQVDKLIELFCLSEEQLNQRKGFASELTVALSEYFGSNVSVSLFGSSISTVGTIDSDVDASIFFGDQPLSKKESELGRTKYSLLTSDVNTLRCRNLQPEEFARLTLADRIRLLTKILNDIRRRGLVPINDQHPILDARCPLVRFLYARKFTIDLSVDNRLGFAKSSWIKSIISSDVSSTVRRFFVAFRFFALVHGLMNDEEHTRGHFNAYTLNLLCVIFLQQHSYIEPLQRGDSDVIIDGWDIGFTVHPVDLSHISLSQLIKDFFVWFIQLKLKGNVFCPRLGSSLTVAEFSDAFPQKAVEENFKISILSLQDPLELSHNVAQLVSEKYIATMRREMMLAVSRMKTHPDCFVTLLRAQSVEPRPSDLSIFVDAKGVSISTCVDAISKILVDLLAFEVIDREPTTKRRREAMGDGAEGGGDRHCLLFDVQSAAWAGRRNVRRKFAKLRPELDDWELDKIVTMEGYEKTLSLRVQFDVFADGERARVDVSLVSGSNVDLHNLAHFLSQFLPKHFPHSVSQIVGSIQSDSIPMEE